MAENKRSRITVAEGMLPLLDVSILLLGFFLILFAMGAFSADSASSESEDSIPGLSAVIVLQIQADGRMTLDAHGGEGETKDTIGINELEEALEQFKTSPKNNKKPLVLINYEDPFPILKTKDDEIRQILKETKFHRSRIYKR